MRGWTNLAASVLAAAVSLTAAASAADDLPILSWQPKDVKDPMTDAVTHTAVSESDFQNGTRLAASAKCDKFYIEFAFDIFSSNATPAPLAGKDKTLVRVRVDDGDVRAITVQKEYNEARAVFYDPDAAKRVMRSMPCDNEICGLTKEVIFDQIMNELKQNAPGTLAVLANATSVRLELPLADGRADAFELNPRDQALRTIVRACAADLHADMRTTTHELLEITCAGVNGNNDRTEKDEPIRQGIFPVDRREISAKTGRDWFHVSVDGKNFWIVTQACVAPQIAACLIDARHYAAPDKIDWHGTVSVATAKKTGRSLGDRIEIALPDGGTFLVRKVDFDEKSARPECKSSAQATKQ